MKKFITMILAIAMVITSVVVPMDKVKAAVGDYVWKRSCSSLNDGSYCIYKLRIVGYDNNECPITDSNAVAEAYYDANDNMIGLFENGVWTKRIAVDSIILPLDCYGRCWTIDDDGTQKEWDKDGNLIYQLNPDGKVVIDKRMKRISVHARKTIISVFGDMPNGDYTIVAGCTDTKPLTCCDEDLFTLDVTWSSSDSTIATVNESNTLVGKKAGKVTMTATVKASGQKVSIPVKVVKNECETENRKSITQSSIPRASIRLASITRAIVSYDTKGNLILKLKLRNPKKKKVKVELRKMKLTISDGKSTFKTTKRVKTTVKAKKTKTITVKIEKSKLKGKVFCLPRSYVTFNLGYSKNMAGCSFQLTNEDYGYTDYKN